MGATRLNVCIGGTTGVLAGDWAGLFCKRLIFGTATAGWGVFFITGEVFFAGGCCAPGGGVGDPGLLAAFCGDTGQLKNPGGSFRPNWPFNHWEVGKWLVSS